ncbi:RNA polymerase II transcription mediator complex subunit 9-domain-containing protein [Poronia punctata]|nr:RNA polymerase II transcription mediator complex subunit 9-domain-containing protein [Poronia punctata]
MSTTTTTATTGLPLPNTFNPDQLDVLSELAHLLTRLRTSTTSGTGTTPNININTNTNNTKTKNGELSLKDIPPATDALRHRFQRARYVIKTTLPDLERDISEQEAEMAALEARIVRQRDTLAKLREVGARLGIEEDGDGDGDGDGDDQMMMLE